MKIFFIILGLICLGLGCIGVALPILPTTPFLLAAAFCFAKSSERLSSWFMGTRLYKNNLEPFVRGNGMTWRAKLRIMATVTVIMVIAFIAMRGTTVGRICLAVVWAAHIIAFCFIIKTCPREEESGEEK
ncbi:MAG: YbaN family protein [Oscillospiraceae bacterium]|nr:YbaN family protein [Oscillospiraceae bacterium]